MSKRRQAPEGYEWTRCLIGTNLTESTTGRIVGEVTIFPDYACAEYEGKDFGKYIDAASACRAVVSALVADKTGGVP